MFLSGSLIVAVGAQAALVHASTTAVRYLQGTQHGFVVVRTQDGRRIATGDVTQTVRGDVVTCHLAIRFRDGSIDDDTTVYAQRGVFRLVSDHHIQSGPTFPKPVDVSIETKSGQVTSRDVDGTERVEHMDLPDDLANGLPLHLLMNMPPSTTEMDFSYLLPAGKPRLIRVKVKAAGTVPFTVGGTRRKAIDYALHVELGGLTGVIAPLIGKQPADFHIWIIGGAHPAFIREEGQFFEGGPVWRIEQVSPSFAAK